MSLFNIISKYLPLLEHPYFSSINSVLSFLNLNQTANLLINVLCINLLSSGVYSLMKTFENLYGFEFKNYIHRKLYAIMLSIIIVFIIVLGLSLSFTFANYTALSNINMLIDFIVIFVSLTTFYKLSTFQKLKNIYIGSLLSSLFLTIFLNLFYTVVSNFTKMSSYYGILPPIIILFLLVYYSCYIIFFGIIVNYETKKFSRIKL